MGKKHTKALLEKISHAVNDAGGLLETGESEKYRQRYRSILKSAETECPPPNETKRKGKRGMPSEDRGCEFSIQL